MLRTPDVCQVAASRLALLHACAVVDFDTTRRKAPGTPGRPAVVDIATPVDATESDATRAFSMTLAVALVATASAVVIVTGGASAASPMQEPFASELASSLGLGAPAVLEEPGGAVAHTLKSSSLRQGDTSLGHALT
jgi:hypothetical protein